MSPDPKALLDAGANPQAHTLDGCTPWDLIQHNDSLEKADAYWLLAGANNIEKLKIEEYPNFSRWGIPLYGAARWSRDADVVKALLNAGASPNAQISDGSTPWDLIEDFNWDLASTASATFQEKELPWFLRNPAARAEWKSAWICFDVFQASSCVPGGHRVKGHV